MPRRTLARRNLFTFDAQPWNLFEDDPGAGGGGGGAPTVNEHGYPDGKPVADMEPTHQVAYWKHHARKHEQRANAAPDATELERLRAAEAELATRKAADLTDAERLQAEKDAAEAARLTAERERDAARADALRITVAAAKGLTPAQASRLRGSTKEELEADADDLLKDFAPVAPASPPRAGGARGSDVGGRSSVSSGEERYRAKYSK
ncbi:hypothetical protein [Streptomyces sp. NPDC058280]|uniref:hypothetical protein n=1 Tax=Streptomyces sp. NPDC058280 TaxID=3346419 RepID=UPI0036E662DF